MSKTANVPATMPERGSGIAKLEALEASRPAYLAEVDSRDGLDGLRRMIRPSFVKIIQAMTEPELKKEFGEGSLVLTPDRILLTKENDAGGTGVSFMTIIHYTEYCKWTGIARKGKEPMIVDRSFDPRSDIAKKAANKATWSEPNPAEPGNLQANYRYCEHLNYVIKLMEPDLLGLPPVLISFVKTNYGMGMQLGRLLMRRKAPIYAGMYILRSKTRTNDKGTFFIFDVEDHPDTLWAPQECFDQAKAIFAEWAHIIEARGVETVYDEETMEPAVSSGDTGSYYSGDTGSY